MIRHQYFLIKASYCSQKEKAIRREEKKLKISWYNNFNMLKILRRMEAISL